MVLLTVVCRAVGVLLTVVCRAVGVLLTVVRRAVGVHVMAVMMGAAARSLRHLGHRRLCRQEARNEVWCWKSGIYHMIPR